VLVTNGTLQLNDAVVSGSCWGRVKAMINDQGNKVRTAGPSAAVKILGLTSVPTPGSEFHVYKNDREARQVAEERAAAERLQALGGEAPKTPLTLDEPSEKAGGKSASFNVILKTRRARIAGSHPRSLEGIRATRSTWKSSAPALGNVSVNDVQLRPHPKAVILASTSPWTTAPVPRPSARGVEIKPVLDHLRDARRREEPADRLLEPTRQEHSTARPRSASLRLGQARQGRRLHVPEGQVTSGPARQPSRNPLRRKVPSLRRFQKRSSRRSAKPGSGIVLDRFSNFAEGDIIESYEIEKVRRRAVGRRRFRRPAVVAPSACRLEPRTP
jgi:translation initiation factor IF-2